MNILIIIVISMCQILLSYIANASRTHARTHAYTHARTDAGTRANACTHTPHTKKGKGSFYIAHYPVRWTAQSASHFLPSLTDLFIPTPFSASSGSILARQQLRAKTKSLTFPPLSIARYSFIQLSQQGRQWSESKCPIFQTVPTESRTRAPTSVSPAFYH